MDDGRYQYVLFRHPGDQTYDLPPLPPHWEVVPTRLAARRRAYRIGAEHLLLAELLRRHRLDLFHGLNNVVPLRCPCARVVTIHDLSTVRFPQLHTAMKRTYWQIMMRHAVRRSAAIIAVSEATKSDLHTFFGVEPERVTVVPHGSMEWTDVAGVEALEQWGLSPKQYVLFVGTLEPRKNIEALVRAFGLVRERLTGLWKLVLAGSVGWHAHDLIAFLDNCPWRESIVQTGRVSERLLRRLYQDAAVFVYPSTFEGFGFPVLEALSAGTPTVTSNVSSMPEVAGDAAILVDPNSVPEIAKAIESVVCDSRMAQDLSVRGRERARLFTWRRTAELTCEVYAKLGTRVP